MYPPGPAAHAVPGVICLEVFYDSRKGNCNDDDRRRWRKQGGVVGAAASRTRAQSFVRSGRWEPQPGLQMCKDGISVTVGKAIETADKLRPNNGFDRELKILWLRQADAGLRKSVVDKSDTTDFDAVGADILYDREQELLRQDAELLLPEPYDSYYAHYLAAQMDAALGETDRYANEMQLANENQQEFAAWCRHTYLPRMATKWRY